MQIRYFLVFLSLAICSVTPSYGETYTWTDKQGHKHFGDELPPEYISQGKEVDTKAINTVPAVQPTGGDTASDNTTTATAVKIPNSSPKESDSCAQQKRDYLNAQYCFNQCRMVGGGINKAKCADCQDVKKPNC